MSDRTQKFMNDDPFFITATDSSVDTRPNTTIKNSSVDHIMRMVPIPITSKSGAIIKRMRGRNKLLRPRDSVTRTDESDDDSDELSVKPTIAIMLNPSQPSVEGFPSVAEGPLQSNLQKLLKDYHTMLEMRKLKEKQLHSLNYQLQEIAAQEQQIQEQQDYQTHDTGSLTNQIKAAQASLREVYLQHTILKHMFSTRQADLASINGPIVEQKLLHQEMGALLLKESEQLIRSASDLGQLKVVDFWYIPQKCLSRTYQQFRTHQQLNLVRSKTNLTQEQNERLAQHYYRRARVSPQTFTKRTTIRSPLRIFVVHNHERLHTLEQAFRVLNSSLNEQCEYANFTAYLSTLRTNRILMSQKCDQLMRKLATLHAEIDEISTSVARGEAGLLAVEDEHKLAFEAMGIAVEDFDWQSHRLVNNLEECSKDLENDILALNRVQALVHHGVQGLNLILHKYIKRPYRPSPHMRIEDSLRTLDELLNIV